MSTHAARSNSASPKPAKTEPRVPTNLRTLLILEAVGKSPTPLTPTEINQHIGLPKQSIHRLCASLVDVGFLSYEPDGKRLRPARRTRAMAAGALYASRNHIARHQIIQEVAARTRETVNFVVPEDNGMSYIDRVDTDWSFRVQLPVGSHVPFHCTASGKTFLSSLKPRARKLMLESLTLEALTGNTITDIETLAAELDKIAEQGYAIDRQEFMDGMVAIAVPIRDEDNRYLASLAFHGPTLRLSEESLLSHYPFLTDA
ncbi:MAG: IclR family transcriptional regulator, partial [Pseudomonadota bacterium]